MKTFKNFLGEAKQIKVGDKVKSKNTFASTNNVSGKVVDIKTVKFASGDQTRYVVQEPDGYKIELRADDIIKESIEINEAQNQQANFEKALRARDAEIEIVRATHPLAKGKYSIKVYAPSVDKSVVFYADVTQFRGDYMG